MKKNSGKRMAAFVLAALILASGLSGCARQAEQPEISDSVNGLSEGNPQGNKEDSLKDNEENFPGNKEDSQKDFPKDEKQDSPEQSEEKKETVSAKTEKSDEEKPESVLLEKEETEQSKENLQTEEQAASQQIPAAQNVSTQGLDNTKLGWGPGGPVDENNRPSGAVSYQEKYGKYDADFIREQENNIYLTFDEGYENGYTDDILDVLKEKGVSAVFFVTMPYVKAEPELIQRMIDEGHIVGNHSVNHLSMPETNPEQCRNEIMELHDYVKENFQYEMTLFRFPMGEFSERDLSIVQQLGYRSVFWSFAYRDWLVDEQPNPQEALEKIESKCHPGAIYLLHAVSQTNAEILGQMIDDLQVQGYTFCKYE